MRGVVVTLAVGATAAAAFFGLGLGVQAAGLPSAPRGARVGATVAGLLLRHRLTTSTYTIDGSRQTAQCLHSWFPRANGRLGRGTLLRRGDGGLVLENGGPIRWVGIDRPPYPPRLEFFLAGCTWDLGNRVAEGAQLGAIRLSTTTRDGRPALELAIGRLHDATIRGPDILDQVKVWVDPRTYALLGVWARVGRHEGSSRATYGTVTPALLHGLVASAAKATG